MSRYEWEGRPLPRVSNILGAYEVAKTGRDNIEIWKQRVPDWSVWQAWGILMHLGILSRYTDTPIEQEHKISYFDLPPTTSEELQGRFRQWLLMEMDIGPKPLVEQKIYHIEPGEEFGGTPDLAGLINKYKSILDLKSTQRRIKKHRLQLGAYYLGLKRVGYEAERGYITYIRKEDYDIVEMDKSELVDASNEFRDEAKWYHCQNYKIS